MICYYVITDVYDDVPMTLKQQYRNNSLKFYFTYLVMKYMTIVSGNFYIRNNICSINNNCAPLS